MSNFRHILSKTLYIATWPIWYLVFKFFIRFNVEYRDESVKHIQEGPVLVMVNHVAWFDPFMVGVCFPINSKMYPIRWLTKEFFFHVPVVGQVVWVYGSLKLVKGIGIENTLAEAVDILKNGGTVGIFPEGKVRKAGRPRKGRRGVAYLAAHTNPVIVPVYIKGAYQITFWDIILRRKNITAHVGRPLRLPRSMMHNPHDLDEAAEFLMNKVRELKK